METYKSHSIPKNPVQIQSMSLCPPNVAPARGSAVTQEIQSSRRRGGNPKGRSPLGGRELIMAMDGIPITTTTIIIIVVIVIIIIYYYLLLSIVMDGYYDVYYAIDLVSRLVTYLIGRMNSWTKQ